MSCKIYQAIAEMPKPSTALQRPMLVFFPWARRVAAESEVACSLLLYAGIHNVSR